MISGAQIKAARGLVGLSQEELAAKAEVSVMTVKRFETSEQAAGNVASLTKMKRALEEAGIVFIDAGPDGGAGVRLAK